MSKIDLGRKLENKETFSIQFDRSSSVIGFQEQFWQLIGYLKEHEIPWYNEEVADDHAMVWNLLGLIWKTDPRSVTLTFEWFDRWKGEWDEEGEKYVEFLDSVYGFRYNVDVSFLKPSSLYKFSDFELVEKEAQLDLSSLLGKWGR